MRAARIDRDAAAALPGAAAVPTVRPLRRGGHASASFSTLVVQGHRLPARRQARRLCRRHHEIGEPAAAVRAPEPQLDQRLVAAAGVDQALQIGIAPMAAGLAPHQHADIAGAQCRPRCRQFVVVIAHSPDSSPMEDKQVTSVPDITRLIVRIETWKEGKALGRAEASSPAP
jgi:hypothetical protein